MNGERMVSEQDELVLAKEPMGAALVTQAANDIWLANVTKAAENAPVLERAMSKILLASTRAEDWTIQGSGDKAKAGLGSAGAERLLKHFPISFCDWRREKEEWSDSNGKAYRWRYIATATLWGRQVQAEGNFSTRDRFLGFVNGEWRPLEDINESDIMSAARHVCIGVGIKTLLGLRNVPVAYYTEIMTSLGQKPSASSKVDRAQGSKGGLSDQDRKHQGELDNMIMEMVYGDKDEAKKMLSDLTSFQGDDGQIKSCDTLERLRAGWLERTLRKAKEIYTKFQQAEGGHEPGARG